MNAPARPIDRPLRHRFTVDDVASRVEGGLVSRDANLELIDRDLIGMPAAGESQS